MQKFRKDIYGGDYVHVFIIEFTEGSYVQQFALPNVHHVIYRIQLAREALTDRSVKRVSFLLLKPGSNVGEVFLFVFTNALGLFKVENADGLAGS